MIMWPEYWILIGQYISRFGPISRSKETAMRRQGSEPRAVTANIGQVSSSNTHTLDRVLFWVLKILAVDVNLLSSQILLSLRLTEFYHCSLCYVFCSSKCTQRTWKKHSAREQSDCVALSEPKLFCLVHIIPMFRPPGPPRPCVIPWPRPLLCLTGWWWDKTLSVSSTTIQVTRWVTCPQYWPWLVNVLFQKSHT